MSDYSQPEFYRFNEDSIRLVNYVSQLSGPLQIRSAADFGAGCGVIGIEYALRKVPEKIYFLEAQEDFLPHLEANISKFLPKKINSEILMANFSQCPWLEMNFDLILSNPPFYLPGHGQRASDLRKHICRTFYLDSWEILLQLTKKNLSPMGRAYFVIPQDPSLMGMITGLAQDLGLVFEKNEERNLFFLTVRLNKD